MRRGEEAGRRDRGGRSALSLKALSLRKTSLSHWSPGERRWLPGDTAEGALSRGGASSGSQEQETQIGTENRREKIDWVEEDMKRDKGAQSHRERDSSSWRADSMREAPGHPPDCSGASNKCHPVPRAARFSLSPNSSYPALHRHTRPDGPVTVAAGQARRVPRLRPEE